MKTLSASLKALVVASLACAAGFATADTQTLAVTATVTGVCKFSATSTPLAFGTLDPSTIAADKQVTANVVYKCTNKTASLGITGLTGPLTMSNGTDTLAFSLAIAGDTSTGKGFVTGATTDLTAVVTGTVTVAAIQAAAAGSYTKDITLSITP
jgi:hypothetical protein